MEHRQTFGYVCGIVGWGCYNLFIDIPPSAVKFMGSVVTAAVCALVGAAVKHGYDLLLKPRIEKYFKK
jgi:hypothetical protein